MDYLSDSIFINMIVNDEIKQNINELCQGRQELNQLQEELLIHKDSVLLNYLSYF